MPFPFLRLRSREATKSNASWGVVEPRDAVILHQPSFVVTFSFTFARCPRRLHSKTRSAALLPHFLRVLGERAVSPRETKERKRGANKERTMRTVDVRGAAKTANNGRGQWEEEQKGTERNRGGTQDAFKVVSTSVQPLCLALYLSRLWQSGKRRIRVLSSAYEIPRRSSRVYVKERAVSPSGWLLSIISPFFRLRDTRDRGQRPLFYPPVRPFRGTSSLTRATPSSGRTRPFVSRKLARICRVTPKTRICDFRLNPAIGAR